MRPWRAPGLIGINHVALEVGDLDAALELYGRLFELRAARPRARMAFLDMGDQFLAVAEGRRQGPDGGRHFGLVVDDREAVRAALKEAGIEPRRGRGLEFSRPVGQPTSRSSSTATSSSRRPSRCCAGWGSTAREDRARARQLAEKGLAG